MNKFLSLLGLGLLLLLFSCTFSSEQQKDENKDPQVESNIGRNNYAVIWDWTTTDEQIMIDHATVITKELLALWESDVVENAYFDADAAYEQGMPFPSISFFMKAHSLEEAKEILNELTIVKQGIAYYQLFPVGTLWMGQNREAAASITGQKSFVTIWTLEEKRAVDEVTKAQSDAIIALWNKGVIENVYFDVEGIHQDNEETDFVFYVKAENIEEAKEVCEELPFYQQGLASYKLYPAGVFWLDQGNQE